jgi:hypothetical protein
MDPSDRLRQDQDRQNRQRQYDLYDRRHFIGSLRSRARISDLTDRIEAERKKRSDEALEDMWTQWPKTRAAIENCSAVAPDTQTKWLERLEAIRNSGKWSAADQLDDLERQVNGVAEALSRMSAGLQKAAEHRRLVTMLPALSLFENLQRTAKRRRPYRLLDFSDRGMLPAGLPSGVRDRLRPHPLEIPPSNPDIAEDLQSIHDGLLETHQVRAGLRGVWINQLEQTDRGGHGTRGSSAEKAEALAGAIEAVATTIRAVGSALRYQATKCRSYWV